MEAIVKPRLHPLLTAAAISVTVFSAVGVGALTGLLPTSRGSIQESPVATTPAAQVAVQPAPQAALAPVTSETAPVMPAAPAASPVHKPVKKHVVARATPPAPPVQVANNDFGQDPRIAQAPATTPPPPPVEAPRPAVPAGTFGVVESVKEVSQPAKSNGLGPIAGGIAGAVLGNQVGHGMGKNIATVLGAAGGAYAGKEVEQRARAEKHWETTVRLDDGSYRTVSSSTAPIWQSGSRVRLVEGKLLPA